MMEKQFKNVWSMYDFLDNIIEKKYDRKIENKKEMIEYLKSLGFKAYKSEFVGYDYIIELVHEKTKTIYFFEPSINFRNEMIIGFIKRVSKKKKVYYY